MDDVTSDALPDRLNVPADVWAAAIDHLRRSLPHEGVGLFSARESDRGGGVVAKFYPGTNVDGSPVRYTMAPAEVVAAFRDMEREGTRLAAIVHSHPRTAPVPSDTDRRESYYPDVLVVIVGFMATVPEARAWQALRDGAGTATGFAPAGLTIG